MQSVFLVPGSSQPFFLFQWLFLWLFPVAVPDCSWNILCYLVGPGWLFWLHSLSSLTKQLQKIREEWRTEGGREQICQQGGGFSTTTAREVDSPNNSPPTAFWPTFPWSYHLSLLDRQVIRGGDTESQSQLTRRYNWFSYLAPPNMTLPVVCLV